MSQRITQQQLESYLWGAATLLRGTIDAGDYKQFIFPLLFYKRLCDVFDEETQAALKESGGDTDFAAYPENHRFQIPSEAHWRNVRQAAKNVGKALQSAMRTIETANPDKLYGIFGDAQWTNKDRLSDAMLRDLVEHFSTLELAVANLPEDELGQGYEYLIKKFADDAGHTAAEFYTNRTVVHLMTEMLKPQPSESIYDPTCGSGGMLLSCITHLRRQGQEWRNVRLYGQERNLMTSSIARMNCFLHGIEEFQIVRGDTLSEPKFVQRDRLMRFDVVLANPPYSIKQWDRDAFASDPWGRNLFGTPPQGRADYAFWQHILCSLSPKTGRCAILFPHGVLFRQEEAEMRRKLIDTDVVECVLGLGPNLFYNSPMEACVVICRAAKPKTRKGRILFINAINEVTRERAQSFLTDDHIDRVVNAYENFKDEPGFTHVATLQEIRKQEGSLNIPLYVVAKESAVANEARTNGSAISESLGGWLNCMSEVGNALHEIPVLKIPLPKPPSAVIAKKLPAWLKREEWKRVPFGKFADSVNERVEPADAADEVYVGLDDLDSRSLRVRRWGQGRDVIGTKLRFRKGDIIFGRRRAYQRKLAVAEMDGICSAHALVVRAKPDMVLPTFLPFLMMSDVFMKRAVEISVGSLSPTINWTTLKLEEFDLPPLDQQDRIGKVLWAVNHHKSQLEVTSASLQGAYDAFADAELANGSGTRKRLSELSRRGELDIQTGPFGTVLKASSYAKSGTPIINPVNMRKHRLWVDAGPFLGDEECSRLARYRMKPGDVLLGRKGDVGRAVLVTEEYDGYIVGSDIIRLRLVNSDIRPDYFYYFMLAPRTRAWITRHASGTTMPGINEKLLNSIEIPVPSADKQAKLVHAAEEMNRAEDALLEGIAADANLILSLANCMTSQTLEKP
jgi:type I restriction enzyme M protein